MHQHQHQQDNDKKQADTGTESWTRDKKILYKISSDVSKLLAKRTSLQPRSPLKLHNSDSRHARVDDPTTGSDHSRTDANNNIHNHLHYHTASNCPTLNTTTTNSTIIGHYELKKTLGKGNFSTVKLAQHRITRHLVAIKVVKISILSEDNLMKINREIDVLKKLGKHDHIVRLYQVIKTKRYFMLVTEYCADGELYDYLVTRGKLSEPQSCNYFLQVLSAVEYLHKNNVVHRDLKAENLLLSNNYKTIKIADFGFANYYKTDQLLSTWCGSPPYAAPELFKGLKYVGPPVDIWSMGVILYVLVCGSLPFDGHNLVYLKSRVLSGRFRIPFFMSTECEGLIRGMLRLDPERRYTMRQIKGHRWTVKHNCSRKAEITVDNVCTAKTSSSENNTAYVDTTNRPTIKSGISDSDNSKNSDKSSSSNDRGQSLDLEDDDKRNQTSVHSNEDTSMLCLISASEEKASSEQKDVSVKPLKIQHFVDNEILNAVSNMSLDSNNSSMSVSQNIDTTISGQSALGSSTRISGIKMDATTCLKNRSITKENSFDDQIIEYMVENLRVADSEGPIRQSVTDDLYDDLHAMYRLLKDQPDIIFETLRANLFKIPSLPVIPLNRQQNSKKPSITTGFINTPQQTTMTTNNSSVASHCDNISASGVSRQEIRSIKRDDEFDLINRCFTRTNLNNDISLSGTQSGAMNLITNNQSSLAESPKQGERQRGTDDSTWKAPPQLFLTPPTESRNFNQISPTRSDIKNAARGDLRESAESSSSKVLEYFKSESKHSFARHSFDSTSQCLTYLPGIPGSSGNTLTLTNCAKHCLWDSSVLDSLGVPTPPSLPSQGDPNSDMTMADTSPLQGFSPVQGNTKGGGLPGPNMQTMAQNLAGISTNLPQIGTQINAPSTTNQNLLLAQLNSLTPAVMTQSGFLMQHNSSEQRAHQATIPAQFMPNNLMNQNYNVMNNFAVHDTFNNTGIPNLNLLDPNGSVSGLERRASDGQASYKSLTTTSGEHNLRKNDEIDRNEEDSISRLESQSNPLDLTKPNSNEIKQNPNSFGAGDLKFQSFEPKQSPSSISLTGGGPGHLLHRRKRHSLETESRHHHYQQHRASHQFAPNFHLISTKYNESNRSLRQTHQYLQYPINSHIGQLRNFAQTFSFKRSMKKDEPKNSWDSAAAASNEQQEA